MAKASSILGLNARYQLFSSEYNTKRGRKIAASKIITYKVLKKSGIPTPEIYAKFYRPREIMDFDWDSLPSSFALKPSKGLGGEGIVIVKKREKDGDGWITTQRKRVTEDDLKLRVLDILEGAYSMSNVPDVALIQEFVGRHKVFRKYAYRGTPDIRIIVFNKVPVMAMLRLPTAESGGRANLHQGAIAVGVDIATGITTRAIWHNDPIVYKPGTKRKLRGIKIPKWNTMLMMAVRCQEVSELGYTGVDIVLHPEKGPMVLELNYQPGLTIQLVNKAGLKKRLERVEDIEVVDAEHGVKIAKALFSARFADRVLAKQGVKTLNVWEQIKVLAKDKSRHEIRAKIDTGAWRSSIDMHLAKELGLMEKENVLWSKIFKSGLGRQRRYVINLTFFLAGRKIKTIASVAKRHNLRTPLIIGRRDLRGFLVSPRKIEQV